MPRPDAGEEYSIGVYRVTSLRAHSSRIAVHMTLNIQFSQLCQVAQALWDGSVQVVAAEMSAHHAHSTPTNDVHDRSAPSRRARNRHRNRSRERHIATGSNHTAVSQAHVHTYCDHMPSSHPHARTRMLACHQCTYSCCSCVRFPRLSRMGPVNRLLPRFLAHPATTHAQHQRWPHHHIHGAPSRGAHMSPHALRTAVLQARHAHRWTPPAHASHSRTAAQHQVRTHTHAASARTVVATVRGFRGTPGWCLSTRYC